VSTTGSVASLGGALGRAQSPAAGDVESEGASAANGSSYPRRAGKAEHVATRVPRSRDLEEHRALRSALGEDREGERAVTPVDVAKLASVTAPANASRRTTVSSALVGAIASGTNASRK
jgi:hypothetical protein